MELQLKITGFILIILALVHIGFPKRFGWKAELSVLSLFTRQVMYVHTFFVAFAILLMGILCIVSSSDLLNTRLGHQVSFGLFLFWVVRLYFQFFVYSSELWKGKPFERMMHYIFAIIWAYFTGVFFLVGTGILF